MSEPRQGQAHACSPLSNGPHGGADYFPDRIPVAHAFPPNPSQNAFQAQGTPQTLPEAPNPVGPVPYNFAAWLKALATQCGAQAERYLTAGDRYSGWASVAETLGGDLTELAREAQSLALRIEKAKLPAVPVPPVEGV